MNSYQVYSQRNIPNNSIRQNNMRLNYVYNKANQNIDHLRDNFNNNQKEAPIRIVKNIYKNDSNEISSILNTDPFFNRRFNEVNSSNNYNSTKYSSFQNNNNEIYSQSQYSNFYRNNNLNNDELYNNQNMPIYPRNSNFNSMNNINRMNINREKNYNLNSKELINFNGINIGIGSKINNIPQNNSFENNFRRSTYSNKSENINIGNNHYNINLSSITSQDIYQSFEKQKKENERKKMEEYSNYLKQQIQEKNKRKELERQKKLKEDLEFERKFQNDINILQQKELNEKINNNKNIINNDVDNLKIVKRNIIDNNKFREENDLDKNILETLRKNQYPLINDNKQNEIISNRNKKNNYKLEDTELIREKDLTNRSMVKSGLDIIEKNKFQENFNQKGTYNVNELNNSNKKINTNKETELYLDKIIQKTDLLTQNLNKTQVDDERMKDIIKVLGNNKNDKSTMLNNFGFKNNYTPDKNKFYENNKKEQEIQDINLGEINYHSKYEKLENINKIKNLNTNNNKYKTNNKSKYSSNIKNNEEHELKESMKGVSEFITSTSRKRNEKITGINLFNNYNYNNKNSSLFVNERNKDKKYILKDSHLNNKINQNEKTDLIEVKDSLNSNMKLTFGEGGNLKFNMSNNNDNYNNKINESQSTLSETKNPEKSLKQYTFGENFQKEKNNSNKLRKQNIKEDEKENKEEKEDEEIDEDDEEKYDIKVNSENDINYDNMLKSTHKSDLKFLDFDQFCDIENDTENNKNKKRKKKKKTNKHQKNNMNEINEDDEICNITISDKEDNNNKNEKNKDNTNKMTESKKIQMQLNFFSDSITKGISHKRNDKSIFKNNNENNDDNINLISKETIEQIKKNNSNDDKIEEINRNILEESNVLKDSYGDNILKNIDKFRGELQ